MSGIHTSNTSNAGSRPAGVILQNRAGIVVPPDGFHGELFSPDNNTVAGFSRPAANFEREE